MNTDASGAGRPHEAGGGQEDPLGELRRRLEDALAHARLDKSQLAARARLSRTTLHGAFAGERIPSAATVAKLARALGLPDAELLDLRRRAAGGAAPGGGGGPGKPVGQWDPHDLEVHPSGAGAGAGAVGSGDRSVRALSGYVARAHDLVLADAVRDASDGRSQMLVLVGSSSTGKTRACWEAVQPLAARGWRLWHPYEPTRAQAALADLEHVAPRTVVWLNEAQHYLGDPQAGERIAAALHTLLTHSARGPVLILGTLWSEYADQYAALPAVGSPDPHSRVRELLTGRTLTVPDAFTREALSAATALARRGDRLLTDALTRAHAHGRLAQDLAGAPELLRRFEHGSPAVRAVLEAAMDARRLGVGLHLPQAFLTDAAADYFAGHDWDQLAEGWAEAALEDLDRPVHGKQAPLRRANVRPPRRPPGGPVPATTSGPAAEPVFRLADYLEQHGRAARRLLCPPASFWHAAHNHLTDPLDLDNLAHAAWTRQRRQWAHHLLLRAADAGQVSALNSLVLMRREAGDWEGAVPFALRAADAGEPDALVRLAWWREIGEDWEHAEALYQRAADTGHPHGVIGLARLRESVGDWAGAEVLYERLVGRCDAADLVVLGMEREEEIGDEQIGGILRDWAARAGDPDALYEVATLQELAGDSDSGSEGAEALYRRAADAGHPRAMSELGRMREEAGDWEGAMALYRRAADAGELAAMTSLARMLYEWFGDSEGAEALYRRAAEGAEALAAPTVEAGDQRASTEPAYARTPAEGGGRDAGTPERQPDDSEAPQALGKLAKSREEAGDHRGAEALALRAAEAGDQRALTGLATLRERAGDHDGAERLYRQAADAGHLREGGSSRWKYGLDPDGAPTPPWP